MKVNLSRNDRLKEELHTCPLRLGPSRLGPLRLGPLRLGPLRLGPLRRLTADAGRPTLQSSDRPCARAQLLGAPLCRTGPGAVAIRPGHGRRPHPQRQMMAIASRILAAAPPRFALAGLSMGGYIALEIVRLAPQRVANWRCSTPRRAPRPRSRPSAAGPRH